MLKKYLWSAMQMQWYMNMIFIQSVLLLLNTVVFYYYEGVQAILWYIKI